MFTLSKITAPSLLYKIWECTSKSRSWITWKFVLHYSMFSTHYVKDYFYLVKEIYGYEWKITTRSNMKPHFAKKLRLPLQKLISVETNMQNIIAENYTTLFGIEKARKIICFFVLITGLYIFENRAIHFLIKLDVRKQEFSGSIKTPYSGTKFIWKMPVCL